MTTPAERRVGRAIRKARREHNTPQHIEDAAHEANMREFDRDITHTLHRYIRAMNEYVASCQPKGIARARWCALMGVPYIHPRPILHNGRKARR